MRGMHADHAHDRHQLLSKQVAELANKLLVRGRPDGSSLSLLTEMELSNEIESGKAMHEHQLRNRDKRIQELEGSLSYEREQRSKEIKTAALNLRGHLNDMAKAEARNILLTEENKALKLRVDELEARFKEAAKSAADVGSIKPRRKSPRKAAASGNATTARKKKYTRTIR
jgi:hypothetical protein